MNCTKHPAQRMEYRDIGRGKTELACTICDAEKRALFNRLFKDVPSLAEAPLPDGSPLATKTVASPTPGTHTK